MKEPTAVPLGPVFSLADNLRGLATSWTGEWRDVVAQRAFVADLLAGLTVAAVALPLNLALAVASGLPASAGLVSGAIGGGIAGFFGGASLQVTGPAAALSTMVLALAVEFGAEGVAVACLVVGVVQLAMGLSGAGRLARYVPESVLAGFTTGVGLKLLDGQVPEFLGFKILGFDHKLIDIAKMMHEPKWLHHVSWLSVTCGLAVAFMVTKFAAYKRFPAAIVGIALATFVSVYLDWDISRVGEVPSSLPHPSLPSLDDDRLLDLLVAAVPLGVLAGVESLLSARGVDRMVPTRKAHNSNLELVGQGLANAAVGLMSGLPVSGVVVRSTVNVQSGAKTRLASITHAALLVVAVLYLSKFIAQVPVAALAGLLIVIAIRLVEVRELVHLAKTDVAGALAFVVASVGTLSGHLMLGLVGGLVVHHVSAYLRRLDPTTTPRVLREAGSQGQEHGVRATLGRAQALARRPLGRGHGPVPETAKWLSQIQGRGLRARSSFVHEQASVVGRVFMGDNVHIAAGSSVRADEGTPFFIGANTNLQDGVTLHALKDKTVNVAGEAWAIYIGQDVSVAHNALVHGPCYVGDRTFIGFKSIVHDSVVGSDCFIGHGATVVGVEIPDGRHVPSGRIVDSAEAVAKLPLATAQQHEFNEDVVYVNIGLAEAYQKDRISPAQPGMSVQVRKDSLASWESSWVPAPFSKERF